MSRTDRGSNPNTIPTEEGAEKMQGISIYQAIRGLMYTHTVQALFILAIVGRLVAVKGDPWALLLGTFALVATAHQWARIEGLRRSFPEAS